MSRRKWALVAALTALSLLAVAAATASAHTELRLDPGNGPFTGVTTVQSTPGTPTDAFALTLPGLGTLTCTTNYIEAHVAAHTSPTTITGGVTALTFQDCTDTIPFINLASCHLDATSPLHIEAVFGGANWDLTDPILRCLQAGMPTATCSYTAAVARGNFVNADSSLRFANVAVTHVATSGDLGALCGNNGVWSTAFTHIAQVGTNKTLTVTQS
jgi:hypothetical protein